MAVDPANPDLVYIVYAPEVSVGLTLAVSSNGGGSNGSNGGRK